jgi:hypothetical protein
VDPPQSGDTQPGATSAGATDPFAKCKRADEEEAQAL